MLDKLNKAERIALMDLLVVIAKADGEITAEERKFLDGYSKGLEVSWSSAYNNDIDNVLSLFVSYQSKMIVLIEILRLAYKDGNYSDAERAGVAVIAETLKVNSKDLERAEEWVVEGLKWVNEGEKLLSCQVV